MTIVGKVNYQVGNGNVSITFFLNCAIVSYENYEWWLAMKTNLQAIVWYSLPDSDLLSNCDNPFFSITLYYSEQNERFVNAMKFIADWSSS
jgi:hypothetical protein